MRITAEIEVAFDRSDDPALFDDAQIADDIESAVSGCVRHNLRDGICDVTSVKVTKLTFAHGTTKTEWWGRRRRRSWELEKKP